MNGAAPDRGLHDGDRDGWMSQLCDNLARILRGRHAQALLDGELPQGNLALVELPSWLWMAPAINVGRKGKPRAGEGVLAMPVRLHWIDGTVLHLLHEAEQSRQVAWVVSGLGHTGTGSIDIHARAADGHWAEEPMLTAVPESVSAPLRRRAQVIARLEHLVADGRAARWEAMTEMEQRIRWALDRAHVAVSCEVDGIDPNSADKLLDEVTISSLADGMLLGEDDTPGFAERLIDLCIDKPTVFAKVDPLKYIVTRTRSEAETVIRRKLGDPHVGRKIRALSRESGETNLDRLLDLYRERYTSDSLAKNRAAAALSVSPSPMARATVWESENDSLSPRKATNIHALIRHNPEMTVSYEDALVDLLDSQAAASGEQNAVA